MRPISVPPREGLTLYNGPMTIFLGADHGGFELKETLKQSLATKAEHSVTDTGAFALNPTDNYPEFAVPVAQAVAEAAGMADVEPATWGVLICRSGGGMAIAANRLRKVRAVVCRTLEDVDHARRHNNANILVLEGDHVVPETALSLLQNFLNTPFDGGRHTQRVQSLG